MTPFAPPRDERLPARRWRMAGTAQTRRPDHQRAASGLPVIPT
jgi:hypothetical protein